MNRGARLLAPTERAAQAHDAQRMAIAAERFLLEVPRRLRPIHRIGSEVDVETLGRAIRAYSAAIADRIGDHDAVAIRPDGSVRIAGERGISIEELTAAVVEAAQIPSATARRMIDWIVAAAGVTPTLLPHFTATRINSPTPLLRIVPAEEPNW